MVADLLLVSKTVPRHQAALLMKIIDISVRNDSKLVLQFKVMGRGQVVRHQFLVLAFAGSNPAAPAK